MGHTYRQSLWLRAGALSTCAVFICTNVLFAQRANPSFWEERRNVVAQFIERRSTTPGNSTATTPDGSATLTTGKSGNYNLLAQLPAFQTSIADKAKNWNTSIAPLPVGQEANHSGGEALSSFRARALVEGQGEGIGERKLNGTGEPPTILSSIAPFAEIKEIYSPSLAPGPKPLTPVFIIQDVHQHYEAQKNIFNVLNVVAQFTGGEALSSFRIKRRSKHDTATTPDGFGKLTTGKSGNYMATTPDKSGNYKPNELNAPVVIGLEGAIGPFDFSPYRAYSDKQLTADIADFFMQQGMIGGPEFFGITTPEDSQVRMVGVEDEKLYLANIQAFKDSLPLEQQVKVEVNKRQVEIKIKKEKAFNSTLLELDKKREAYHEGKLNLGEYLTLLKNTATTPDKSGNYRTAPANVVAQFTGGEALSSFRIERRSNHKLPPNIVLLVEAYQIEKSLDISKLESERSQILSILTEKLPKPTLDELLNSALAYKTGNITYAQFYAYFKETSKSAGINFSQFQEMDKYVRYVQLADSIDKNKLFSEIEQLENHVENKLVKTAEEKLLLQESKYLELANKLVNFSLTPEEWNSYMSSRSSVVAQFIGRRFNIPDESGETTTTAPDKSGNYKRKELNELNELSLSSFEQFYETALKRNETLISNLLESTNSDNVVAQFIGRRLNDNTPTAPDESGNYNEPNELNERNNSMNAVAVLVAGGFHTQGITHLLKNKNIPYVVLAPDITKVEEGQKSLDIIARAKTPLDKLFAGEKIFLQSPRYLGKPIEGFTTPDSLNGAYATLETALSENFEQATQETNKIPGQRFKIMEATRKIFGLFSVTRIRLHNLLTNKNINLTVIKTKESPELVESLPTHRQIVHRLKKVLSGKIGNRWVSIWAEPEPYILAFMAVTTATVAKLVLKATLQEIGLAIIIATPITFFINKLLKSLLPNYTIKIQWPFKQLIMTTENGMTGIFSFPIIEKFQFPIKFMSKAKKGDGGGQRKKKQKHDGEIDDVNSLINEVKKGFEKIAMLAWINLKNKWNELPESVRVNVLVSAIESPDKKEVARDVWDFLREKWPEFSETVRSAVTPERLVVALKRPSPYGLFIGRMVWDFLRERWPELSEDVRSAVSPNFIALAFKIQETYYAKKALDFLRERWPELSETVRISGLASALVNPSPRWEIAIPAARFLRERWPELSDGARILTLGSALKSPEYDVRIWAWRLLHEEWPKLSEGARIAGLVSALEGPLTLSAWDFLRTSWSELSGAMRSSGLRAAFASNHPSVVEYAWYFLRERWPELSESEMVLISGLTSALTSTSSATIGNKSVTSRAWDFLYEKWPEFSEAIRIFGLASALTSTNQDVIQAALNFLFKNWLELPVTEIKSLSLAGQSLHKTFIGLEYENIGSKELQKVGAKLKIWLKILEWVDKYHHSESWPTIGAEFHQAVTSDTSPLVINKQKKLANSAAKILLSHAIGPWLKEKFFSAEWFEEENYILDIRVMPGPWPIFIRLVHALKENKFLVDVNPKNTARLPFHTSVKGNWHEKAPWFLLGGIFASRWPSWGIFGLINWESQKRFVGEELSFGQAYTYTGATVDAWTGNEAGGQTNFFDGTMQWKVPVRDKESNEIAVIHMEPYFENIRYKAVLAAIWENAPKFVEDFHEKVLHTFKETLGIEDNDIEEFKKLAVESGGGGIATTNPELGQWFQKLQESFIAAAFNEAMNDPELRLKAGENVQLEPSVMLKKLDEWRMTKAAYKVTGKLITDINTLTQAELEEFVKVMQEMPLSGAHEILRRQIDNFVNQSLEKLYPSPVMRTIVNVLADPTVETDKVFAKLKEQLPEIMSRQDIPKEDFDNAAEILTAIKDINSSASVQSGGVIRWLQRLVIGKSPTPEEELIYRTETAPKIEEALIMKLALATTAGISYGFGLDIGLAWLIGNAAMRIGFVLAHIFPTSLRAPPEDIDAAIRIATVNFFITSIPLLFAFFFNLPAILTVFIASTSIFPAIAYHKAVNAGTDASKQSWKNFRLSFQMPRLKWLGSPIQQLATGGGATFNNFNRYLDLSALSPIRLAKKNQGEQTLTTVETKPTQPKHVPWNDNAQTLISSFIKVATVEQKVEQEQEIIAATVNYNKGAVSEIDNTPFFQRQIIGEINYNREFADKFLYTFFENNDDRSSPRTLEALRPFMAHVVNAQRYSWTSYNSPYKAKYNTLKTIYEKIERKMPRDPGYRLKLVSEIENTLRSFDKYELESLMAEIVQAAVSNFEHAVKYNTEIAILLEHISPFNIQYVINNPSPAAIDKDNHVLELNLFAFLNTSHLRNHLAERTLKTQLRKFAVKPVVDEILTQSGSDAPENILTDILLILADDKDINMRWSFGNRKIIARNRKVNVGNIDDQDVNKRRSGGNRKVKSSNTQEIVGPQGNYIDQLQSNGARQYATLIRKLSQTPNMPEKIRLIYDYLKDNFDLAETYNLHPAHPVSLDKVIEFLSENPRILDRIELAYQDLHQTRPEPSGIPTPTTGRSEPPAPITGDDRPVEKETVIEVEHLKMKDREKKPNRVPDYAIPYVVREEREETATGGEARTSKQQPVARVEPRPEYRTPHRGEDYYQQKIREITPLLETRNDIKRLRIFLGQIFPWYLVARADHADGSNLKNAVSLALARTVSMTSSDHGFTNDINSLMDTTSPAQIRQLASSFRNNPFLINSGIYFGIDLASAREGTSMVNVLYATIHSIGKRRFFRAYNRSSQTGEELPIYYLGRRLDSLDKEMNAFGFTWRGDIFGAVIKDAITYYVYHSLFPILQDKPYLISDYSRIHPLTYAISAAVKREFATNKKREILKKAEQITAIHELQHTVDELLGRIIDTTSTETSAYLAGIALSESPYLALIKVIELYTDPFAALFSYSHYQAAARIMEKLQSHLGIIETGDGQDIANAILVRVLELPDEELADLAKTIHEELFGQNALLRLEPFSGKEPLQVEVSEDKEVTAAAPEEIAPPTAEQQVPVTYKIAWQKAFKYLSFLATVILILFTFIRNINEVFDKTSPRAPPSTLPAPAMPAPGSKIPSLPKKSDTTITVFPGNNLTHIAERYYDNASVEIARLIAEHNNIPEPDTVFTWKRLSLPPKLEHIVEEGESFGDIANRYYIFIEDLKQMNPGISDYARIYPGDRIIVAERTSKLSDKVEILRSILPFIFPLSLIAGTILGYALIGEPTISGNLAGIIMIDGGWKDMMMAHYGGSKGKGDTKDPDFSKRAKENAYIVKVRDGLIPVIVKSKSLETVMNKIIAMEEEAIANGSLDQFFFLDLHLHGDKFSEIASIKKAKIWGGVTEPIKILVRQELHDIEIGKKELNLELLARTYDFFWWIEEIRNEIKPHLLPTIESLFKDNEITEGLNEEYEKYKSLTARQRHQLRDIIHKQRLSLMIFFHLALHQSEILDFIMLRIYRPSKEILQTGTPFNENFIQTNLVELFNNFWRHLGEKEKELLTHQVLLGRMQQLLIKESKNTITPEETAIMHAIVTVFARRSLSLPNDLETFLLDGDGYYLTQPYPYPNQLKKATNYLVPHLKENEKKRTAKFVERVINSANDRIYWRRAGIQDSEPIVFEFEDETEINGGIMTWVKDIRYPTLSLEEYARRKASLVENSGALVLGGILIGLPLYLIFGNLNFALRWGYISAWAFFMLGHAHFIASMLGSRAPLRKHAFLISLINVALVFLPLPDPYSIIAAIPLSFLSHYFVNRTLIELEKKALRQELKKKNENIANRIREADRKVTENGGQGQGTRVAEDLRRKILREIKKEMLRKKIEEAFPEFRADLTLELDPNVWRQIEEVGDDKLKNLASAYGWLEYLNQFSALSPHSKPSHLTPTLHVVSLPNRSPKRRGEDESGEGITASNLDKKTLARILPYLTHEQLIWAMNAIDKLNEQERNWIPAKRHAGMTTKRSNVFKIGKTLFRMQGAANKAAKLNNKTSSGIQRNLKKTVTAFQGLVAIIAPDTRLNSKDTRALKKAMKSGEKFINKLAKAKVTDVKNITGYATDFRIYGFDVSRLDENSFTLDMMAEFIKSGKINGAIALFTAQPGIDTKIIKKFIKDELASRDIKDDKVVEKMLAKTHFGKIIVTGRDLAGTDLDAPLFNIDSTYLYERIRAKARKAGLSNDNNLPVELFTETPLNFDLSWRKNIGLRIMAIISPVHAVEVERQAEGAMEKIRQMLRQA